MKSLDELTKWQIKRGEDGGAYRFQHKGETLVVIASTGLGWDHVSVSRRDRWPTWDEMDFMKQKFFRDDETVMQLHVPTYQDINLYPYCLHLWRSQTEPIPMPPPEMVGRR